MRVLAAICAIAALAGCSAGGFAPQPTSPNAVDDTSQSGALVLRVSLASEAGGHSPRYVSPSTKGMTVKIAGPTNVKKTVGLKLTSNGCKSSLLGLTCTLIVRSLKACPSKKPCYTASIATYDAYAAGKIPPGAHELSADLRFAFTIGAGATTVPLVLQGIPKSIAFVPNGTSSLHGSQASGFVEPKCAATTQEVELVGVDADGNFIVGSGAPAVSLATDNAAQLAVTKSGPNAFTLTPPAAPGYAFGNYIVHLTARAVPGSRSGALAISTVVDVAYSGDICGIVSEFPTITAASMPTQLAAGADGAIWFTEATGNRIGRITPAGSITEFSLPTAAAQPVGIASGPDGNVWFTEVGANKIGRMTTAGALTETNIPTSNAQSLFIARGPDGNLWFTEYHGNNVGRITTGGVATEFPITTAHSGPRGITSGPGDALWFTECNASKIASITTAGTVSEFPLTASTGPNGIAEGPENTVWFALTNAVAIESANAAGTVTSNFALSSINDNPGDIVAGPDGAMWFSEECSGRIGRVTPAGTISEYALPVTPSVPFGVALGPDGAIWFTDFQASEVGRIR